MTANSKIEWTDHTFNPWWGCVRVSPGCEHCYAETFDKRLGGAHWGPASTTPRRFFGPKHWAEPLKWNAEAEREGVRRRVFCASMADVFEDNPALVEERARLFELIAATSALDWLLLTKRPENIARLLPSNWGTGWRNVWLGTTVESQEYADKRIPLLLRVPAAVRFLSCEPLLGPVDLRRIPFQGDTGYFLDVLEGRYYTSAAHTGGTPFCFGMASLGTIHWVIAGGESGADARPMHPDWARSLRDQCQAARAAFHFKQWGEWAEWYDHPEVTGRVKFVHAEGWPVMLRLPKAQAGRVLDGRTWDEFPEPVK